jgi:hypothetical protein
VSSDTVGAAPQGRVHTQLTNLHSLLVLSMLMFNDQDEDSILKLAMTSVRSLVPCEARAGYLSRDGELVQSPPTAAPSFKQLSAQLDVLDGEDGTIRLPDEKWGHAIALRSLSDLTGYLVLGAKDVPTEDEWFVLKALASQTGAALANARMRRREHEQNSRLAKLNDERARANERLRHTVAKLEQRTAVHREMARASGSGLGEQGIAHALTRLTGLASVIEDPFGNLRVWAGAGCPDPYPKQSTQNREDFLRSLAATTAPLRHHDRLVALVRPKHDVLGTLALVDPDKTAGEFELFALDQGLQALSLELAHTRSLVEVKLRLCRELVEDLLNGTGRHSAFARSEALGHDLHGTHHVIVLNWHDRKKNINTMLSAVKNATGRLDIPSLNAGHAGKIVLICAGRPNTDTLHRALTEAAGSPHGSIGVGGPCESLAEFPRSYGEAVQALEVREQSRRPDGVTAFDQLGVFRVLDTGHRDRIEEFVREWLGALLDYDRQRHADLVPTLGRYLDCGGNYDAAATALTIHRSTLRYRLQRIREVSGHDLADIDSRLNLHVAVRAQQILDGTP